MDDLERTLSRLFARKAEEVAAAPSEPPVHVLKRIRWRQLASVLTATAVVAALALGSFAGARALAGRGGRPGILPSVLIPSSSAPTPSATTTTVPNGGSVVFGAEDLGECVNPITGCAGSTSLWWTVLDQVLPRAMELDAGGNFVPSPLLVEAPALVNGGLTQDPFRIRYKISGTANWADGSAITSEDIAFTWRAIMHTPNPYTIAGYDQIVAIDTSDPKTAVISFKSVYIDWPDLFGGPQGGIVEEAAFPRADRTAPDLSGEMQTEIPFSGGPWVLDSYTTNQAVLVRNDRYYGKVPLLARVTFITLTDPASEVGQLIQGEVSAIEVFPAAEHLLERLNADPVIQSVTGGSFGFEALWFNNQTPTLDDPKVREALMYAIDRQSVIDQIIKPNDPAASVLNCGFLALPTIGPWCADRPFEQFTYDPARAKSILSADGYDCSSTPCTKHGRPLTIEYSTRSDSDLRDLRNFVQPLIRDQALAAGFDIKMDNYEAQQFYSTELPRGKFTMAEYMYLSSPDPGVTWLLACESIPTKANGFTGANYNRWCDPKATDLMQRADAELDPAQRLALLNQVYEIEAQAFLSLPLYTSPVISAWRADRIAGPIGDYNGSLNGLFFNMNEWYLASA
jgi:peptide/nickel transport system substrate-binding protein